MPNQLAQTKRRKTVAEHVAVFAAMETIAQRENATAMDLLRQAIRQFVRERVHDLETAEEVKQTVFGYAPRMPVEFKTHAQVARFKRQQRDFDEILIELNLVSPAEVQRRNSLLSRSVRPRLVGGV